MNKHPESDMMSYGYEAKRSENSIKTPIFLTSTFAFDSAEDGAYFFENYGVIPPDEQGLIYSRFNHPNLEIAESRLKLWDKAEECLLFSSGMAAVTTLFLSFLKHGDALLFSNPIYGGTDNFIRNFLPQMGIHVIPFDLNDSKEYILKIAERSGHVDRIKMLYIETPANPNNEVIDIQMCREIADMLSRENRVILAVDNTYLGPVWQNPIQHGADMLVYSVTKYIGGHSDLIAGACLGYKYLVDTVRNYRNIMGNMASPFTAWMIQRSLETLKVRMDAQASHARAVADFLHNHPKVEKLYFLGYPQNERQRKIIEKQCLSYGAMIAFEIQGGQKAAFEFLNKLKLFKLAVSLGGTESLAEHPYTMTHKSVSPEDKELYKITDNLIRLSVGLENPDDLISDLSQAFGD
jgi:methionine-gamma-lyase